MDENQLQEDVALDEDVEYVEETWIGEPPAAPAAALPVGQAPPDADREPPPPVPLFRSGLPRSLAYSSCTTLSEFLAAHAGDPFLLPLERRLSEVRLPPDDQSYFVAYPDLLYFVAVVGAHLPDTPAVLPLWMRIAAACPRAELRVVGDDDSAALERLLGSDTVDLDATELPVLFVFDEEWQLQAQWGPRPQAAEPSIDEWLAHHPQYETLVAAEAEGTIGPDGAQELLDLHYQLVLQMRIWYNSGLDAEGSAELRALLASLQGEADPAA